MMAIETHWLGPIETVILFELDLYDVLEGRR
jgi:hypothetical protein